MNQDLRFFAYWLCSMMLILTSQAQDEPLRRLLLTPEPLPRYEPVGYLGGYRVQGTTAFVDELIARHLSGELTLYRDFDQQIAYPSLGPLLGFLDTAQIGAFDFEAGASRGGPENCRGCLSRPAWQWFMFAREAASVTYDNREDLLSQIKQMWKLRRPLEAMAPLQPWHWNPDRFLIFSAEVVAAEDAPPTLRLDRGMVLVEYALAQERFGNTDLAVLVFDPQDEAIPWEKLSIERGMHGINEEQDPRAIILERRTNLVPLGYQVGRSGPLQAFFSDLRTDDGWQQGLQRRDSLLQAWQAQAAIAGSEVSEAIHPRQSRPYRLLIDAGWFNRPVPADPWIHAQYRDRRWEKTLAWAAEASDSLLQYWQDDELTVYAPATIDQPEPRERSYQAGQALLERWLKGVLVHAHAPDFTVVDSLRRAADWQALSAPQRFEYAWRIDGDLIWQRGRLSYQPDWITLVAQDPAGKVSGFPLAAVRVEDLSWMGLQVGRQSIAALLAERKYAYYPLAINDIPFLSLDQATLVSKLLDRGRWYGIPTWLETGDFPDPGAAPADFWQEAWQTAKRR